MYFIADISNYYECNFENELKYIIDDTVNVLYKDHERCIISSTNQILRDQLQALYVQNIVHIFFRLFSSYIKLCPIKFNNLKYVNIEFVTINPPIEWINTLRTEIKIISYDCGRYCVGYGTYEDIEQIIKFDFVTSITSITSITNKILYNSNL